ncbi:cell wall / vacuolar inhibitor of fructosidase 1-like [Actinidia eriantha]|uniref:cell wall / vacuolar inhibitor of fructosidase 1-like n=1 Tax=Actinidia eriantha TaxID=165200 RepID=UPI0025891D71|nr:cell wall / vacuolar inhibitor of fructosidase 1-like [Actinidia eriantha]
MGNSLISLSLASFLVILLSLTKQSPVSAQNDLITTTCKQTPLFQLCSSTLRSNLQSKSADVAGLGLIVVEVIKGKASATLGQVRKLLRAGNPQLKGPLNQCVAFYKTILEADVPEAEQAIRGVPKFAEDGMVDAAAGAGSCEEGFGGKSPIIAMNMAVKDLAVVARAIIRTLL